MPGVTFPTGTVVNPETKELFMYYGAADSCVCVATAKLEDLLDLLVCTGKEEGRSGR